MHRLQQQLQESKDEAANTHLQLQQELKDSTRDAGHRLEELQQQLLAARQDAQDAEATREADALQVGLLYHTDRLAWQPGSMLSR